MHRNDRHTANHLGPFLMLTALLLLLSACGSVQHSIQLAGTVSFETGMLVEVGQATNQTSHTFDVDVVQLLTNGLAEELRSEHLLWSGGEGRRLVLSTAIVEYEEGNAFKR